jgi:hypothetical protein
MNDALTIENIETSIAELFPEPPKTAAARVTELADLCTSSPY